MIININKISKNKKKLQENKKNLEEKNEKLEEKNEKLEEKNEKLEENKKNLEENKKNLEENKKNLEENKKNLEEKNEKLEEKNENNENSEEKEKRKEKKNINKGFITNSISLLFRTKENYSHIHTHVPSQSFPSYKILLKLVSEIENSPELKGFKLLKRYNKLLFYQNIKNEKSILVGIQETYVCSFNDLTTAAQNIFFKTDFKKLKRYQIDLKNIIEFQKDYPSNEYYYMATGASIAGAVIDLFLEGGYIKEAITFNPIVEKRFMNQSDINNYRIYLNEDITYLAMGQYTCNTKVYTIHLKNKIPKNKIFINPINELKYLYHIHTLDNKRSHSLPYLRKILLKEENQEEEEE